MVMVQWTYTVRSAMRVMLSGDVSVGARCFATIFGNRDGLCLHVGSRRRSGAERFSTCCVGSLGPGGWADSVG